MAFIKFKRTAANTLEQGGRSTSETAQAKDEISCPNCHHSYEKSTLAASLMCCPNCDHHFSMGARERLLSVCDRGSFKELYSDVVSDNPLDFEGYGDKLAKAKAASGENEAVLCGIACIGSVRCAVFAMEAKFMMGSMGAAVGERLTRLFEMATEEGLSVVGFTVSGGARMQEGLHSLMQMAKVSAAVLKHSQAGLLYMPVLTSPTTGGVTASFAMEGDIILAEPSALVGFAGKRVIEQTTRGSLPKGFQSAEFLLEKGFIDAIVERSNQRSVLSHLLRLHEKRGNQ